MSICTEGQLEGALVGRFRFTMNTLIPAGDQTPGVILYTGTSVVTCEAPQGTFIGADTGTLAIQPGTNGRQSALITILSGSDGLEAASGFLQLIGGLSFDSGVLEGEYEGSLCR